jgi:hypothetical protein
MEYQKLKDVFIDRSIPTSIILGFETEDLCFRMDFADYAKNAYPITKENIDNVVCFELSAGMKFSHVVQTKEFYLTRPNDERGIIIPDGVFQVVQIQVKNLIDRNIPPPRNYRLSMARKECKTCGQNNWKPIKPDPVTPPHAQRRNPA